VRSRAKHLVREARELLQPSRRREASAWAALVDSNTALAASNECLKAVLVELDSAQQELRRVLIDCDVLGAQLRISEADVASLQAEVDATRPAATPASS
jgi:hypothetical protein